MEKEKIYNLFHMSYVDIQERLKETDVVIVPLGSCEQHGPHLPVCVDSIATQTPCEMAAKKANVVHTPLIWFGYSPQHLKRPGEGSGTVTMKMETYNNILYDVGRSLVHQGFNKIVFSTGHTSNMKVVDNALRRLRYDTGCFCCIFRSDAEAIPKILSEIIENPPEETPGWHGSEVETSEVQYYNEDLVRLDRTKKNFTHAPKWFPEGFDKANGNPYVIYDGWEPAYVPMDHPEYSDTGLIGNPFTGSKEKGRLIAEKVSDAMATFINGIKDVKLKVYNRDYWNRPEEHFKYYPPKGYPINTEE